MEHPGGDGVGKTLAAGALVIFQPVAAADLSTLTNLITAVRTKVQELQQSD